MSREDDVSDAQNSSSRPRPRPGSADSPAPAAAPVASESRSVPAVWYVIGAIGLVCALLVAFVIVLLVKHSDDSDKIGKSGRLDAARTSVLTTARKYAIDFTTYDYKNLDAGFARTESELTGKFKEQYTATTTALKETIIKYKAVAMSRLQDVGIESLTSTDAVVIAFVDQTITNTTSTTPQVDRNRVRMTLHRKGSGPWLITDLQLP